jgi:hypothetical protein
MPPIGFSDEEMDALRALASPLPPPLRDGFLRLVADKLAAYPDQLRGPGLLHRTAVVVQHDLLKNGPVAVGPCTKYSLGQPKRSASRPASGRAARFSRRKPGRRCET